MNRKKYIRGIIKYLLLIVLFACVAYYVAGAPSFTPEMALHRRERNMLVGPSELIASAKVSDDYHGSILIGETDYGYTLLEYTGDAGWDSGYISYHEKNGSVTCFTAATFFDPDFVTVFPVYAIPEDARAVSARLTLETASTVQDEYNAVLTAEAELREDTFFRFEIETAGVYDQILYFWNYRLNGRQDGHGYTSGMLTVELFDRGGQLLDTVTVEFPAYLD